MEEKNTVEKSNESRRRVKRAVRSSRLHTRYLVIIGCMAVIVALGVAAQLRRQGITLTRTYDKQVLACTYSGYGAHTHDSSC